MRAHRVATWLSAAVLCCLAGCSCCSRQPLPEDLGTIDDFSLTERSGRPLHRADLFGKVWLASFVFTRCNGPCPVVTGTMARLQKELAGTRDFRLVSFSVDPDHDKPEVLRDYAGRFGADPERWLFLTGDQQAIYDLATKSFHVAVQENQAPDRTPGNAVTHQTFLVLVDRRGHLRGYYHGVPDPDPDGLERFEENLDKLRQAVAGLIREQP